MGRKTKNNKNKDKLKETKIVLQTTFLRKRIGQFKGRLKILRQKKEEQILAISNE